MHGETVYTDSYALFIGIAKFRNPNIPEIPCAVNDVKTIRDILVKSYGFNPDPGHLTVLTNEEATKTNIERALHRLCDKRKVKKTDRVLVYFSCHGQEVPNPNGGAKGYIIPYDATIDLGDVSNPPQYQDECIEMDSIGTDLESCPARHRALIVDACFSGFALGTKGLGDGQTLSEDTMRALLNEPGLAILTAGTTGDKAGGGNSETDLSAYTKALRDELVKGAIGGSTFLISQLASQAKERTVEATKRHQNPGFGVRDGTGEMILVPTSPSHPAPVVPKPTKEIVTKSFAAFLHIRSDPPGAKVTVDNNDAGITPCEYTVDLSDKESSKVNVTVKLEGYIASGKSDLLLDRSSNEELTFKLIPKPKSNPANNPLPIIHGPTTGGHAYTKLSKKAQELGIEMIYIPGGTFQMGDNDQSEGLSISKPVHPVSLSPYWMSKTPITVAQFRAFDTDTNHQYDWNGNTPKWGWSDNDPMVNVTWEDSKAFCRWAGGDLPTEAQWERAARGTDNFKYPWGDRWDETKCWHSSKSMWGDARRPLPVGHFDHSYETFEGLQDMSGNVWQWCKDWFRASGYSEWPIQNPGGPSESSGEGHTLRGGSWSDNNPEFFRTTYRSHNRPNMKLNDRWGIRLCGNLP